MHRENVENKNKQEKVGKIAKMSDGLFSFLDKGQRMLIMVCLLALLVWVFLAFGSLKTDFGALLMNYIMVLPVFGLLLMMTWRPQIALVGTMVVTFVISFIDGIVYSARLTHLRFGDIFVIGDGLRVANKYDFGFSLKDCLLLVCMILVSVGLVYVSKKMHKKQSKRDNLLIGLATISFAVIFMVIGTAFRWIPDPAQSAGDAFDTNAVVERKGLLYAMYGQYVNSSLKQPEGYSEEEARRILDKYDEPEVADNQEPIDVIVVMNEALTDYALIGDVDFDDPLKNIHDEVNNYFEGKLAVSVFGGYTSNTEFEFLTGASMYFLPSESIPFSQLINSKIPSLVWDMKEMGMNAYGVHPYYSQEWNRRNVYAYLGFDKFIAGEDFGDGLGDKDNIGNVTDTNLKGLDFGDDLEYIRGFVSDKETYKKVLKLLEASEKESNFVFAVTVQNHGGYNYNGEDFLNEKYIDGKDYLNQYLTLSSISDESFQGLIDELKTHKKKTVVLMFGDHQPGLDFTEEVEGYEDDARNQYLVPYVVWSNFGLEGELPENTSVNYLSTMLKQNIKMPLTRWDQLLLKTRSNYPVVTGNFVVDADDNVRGRGGGWSDLDEYEIVQYKRLFGD